MKQSKFSGGQNRQSVNEMEKEEAARSGKVSSAAKKAKPESKTARAKSAAKHKKGR